MKTLKATACRVLLNVQVWLRSQKQHAFRPTARVGKVNSLHIFTPYRRAALYRVGRCFLNPLVVEFFVVNFQSQEIF